MKRGQKCKFTHFIPKRREKIAKYAAELTLGSVSLLARIIGDRLQCSKLMVQLYKESSLVQALV